MARRKGRRGRKGGRGKARINSTMSNPFGRGKMGRRGGGKYR